MAKFEEVVIIQYSKLESIDQLVKYAKLSTFRPAIVKICTDRVKQMDKNIRIREGQTKQTSM